jgi:HSP20 family protein
MKEEFMAFRRLPDVWRGGARGEWNPFRDFGRMQRQMDRMFGDMFSEPFGGLLGTGEGALETNGVSFVPACDVEETESHYLVSFDLPGVKKDDVKIEFSENQLTVSGERKEERKSEDKGRTSTEKYYGSFMRSFTLPAAVKADKVEASFADGVLQISLPKAEISPGKHIPIKEGKLIEAKSGRAS